MIDADLFDYIAAKVPAARCDHCGRVASKSTGCPTKCPCQYCHGRKCKGECK